MVPAARFRTLCASLSEVEEVPHFDRAAFRTPARIFATLGPSGAEANVRLPPELQDALVQSQPEAFTRLNGAWGAAGWTRMDLSSVDDAVCGEVLREAHTFVGIKKASAKKKALAKKAPAKKKVSARRGR